MKRLKIVSLSLVLGGAFLLTGCLAIQRRIRPAEVEVPRVEVPRVEVPRVEVPIRKELITTHTVRRGDTLWEISERVYGDPTKWRLIFEANRHILDHPDDLKPGQELIIPRK